MRTVKRGRNLQLEAFFLIDILPVNSKDCFMVVMFVEFKGDDRTPYFLGAHVAKSLKMQNYAPMLAHVYA